MMKQFIQHAHAAQQAGEFFSKSIDKEAILMLYTELDYVYDLLESLDIVCTYSKFQLLKDFEIVTGMGGIKYITTCGEKWTEMKKGSIMAEIAHMFTPIS